MGSREADSKIAQEKGRGRRLRRAAQENRFAPSVVIIDFWIEWRKAVEEAAESRLEERVREREREKSAKSDPKEIGIVWIVQEIKEVSGNEQF